MNLSKEDSKDSAKAFGIGSVTGGLAIATVTAGFAVNDIAMNAGATADSTGVVLALSFAFAGAGIGFGLKAIKVCEKKQVATMCGLFTGMAIGFALLVSSHEHPAQQVNSQNSVAMTANKNVPRQIITAPDFKRSNYKTPTQILKMV